MRRVRETTTQETTTETSKPTGRLSPLALGSLSLVVLLPVVLLAGFGSALPTSGVATDPFLVTLALMTIGALLIGAGTLWWIEASHRERDGSGVLDRAHGSDG